MSFREVGGRPLRGMVGMGVIEADDVLAALAAFALNADEFPGIDGESALVLPQRAMRETVFVTDSAPLSSNCPSSTPQHSWG